MAMKVFLITIAVFIGVCGFGAAGLFVYTNVENSRGEDFVQAGYHGDLNRAKRLLDSGVKVDFEFENGGTALMGAAGNGHGEHVKYLLSRGADPTKRDDEGKSAWDLAQDSTIKQVISAAVQKRRAVRH